MHSGVGLVDGIAFRPGALISHKNSWSFCIKWRSFLAYLQSYLLVVVSSIKNVGRKIHINYCLDCIFSNFKYRGYTKNVSGTQCPSIFFDLNHVSRRSSWERETFLKHFHLNRNVGAIFLLTKILPPLWSVGIYYRHNLCLSNKLGNHQHYYYGLKDINLKYKQSIYKSV